MRFANIPRIMKWEIFIAIGLLFTGWIWAQSPDDLLKGATDPIFEDGFESGDTLNWGGVKVMWSPEQLEKAVAVDDLLPVRLTLQIHQDLPATVLWPTPSLEDWIVAITPSELPALSAGTEVTIDLVLTAPAIQEKGGTLHVRQAEGPPRTFAKPLPIHIQGVDSIEDILPPEPDPDEDDATVLGVDSDGDGLRDHIQRYIYSRYPSNPQARAALREVALAHQDILLEGGSTANVPMLFQEQSRALDCFWLVASDGVSDDDLDESHFLLAEMKDTSLRSDAYLHYMTLLGGQVTQSADDASQVCDTSVLILGGGAL